MGKKKDPFLLNLDTSEAAKKTPLDWEESAVDSLSTVEGFSQKTLIRSPKWLSFFVLLVFFIFAVRLVYLQAFKGEMFGAISENNRLRKQTILAPRGIILDRYGKILATNTASFNLVAIPLDLLENELDSQLTKLSEIIQFDVMLAEQRILKAGQASLDPIVIAQNLSLEQSILFESRASEFVGFLTQKIPVRDYTSAESLFHVVGYTGLVSQEERNLLDKSAYSSFDFVGKSGIEQSYENYLHGVNGFSQVEVDARGNLIGKLGTKDPVTGNTLELNLDSDLQVLLYNLLKGSGKRRAAAIALNPKTGGVLALVSAPGLDGSKFSRGMSTKEYDAILKEPSLPLFNRAIAGTYPPGSTVKPMVGLAALQENVINEKTVYVDRGVLVIQHQYDPKIDYNFYGWKRDGLGPVDIKGAIAKSSDIFFYIVSGGYPKQDWPGLGIDKLASYYRKFNLGRVTGIDLPGEKPGLVPDAQWKYEYYKQDPILSRWYLGDTYHVGIGQGDLLATPLQLAEWTAFFANRGVGMQPQVLKRVVKEGTGEILFEQKPSVLIERFADLKYIKLIQEGMRDTILTGSGRQLNTLPITSAGKTGTSQFDGSDPKKTHAWFTAYAPFEDPEIVITVLVEAGGEGSSVAVPVVKQALQWWADNRYKK